MLPSQMWASSNNTTMESWIGATSNVDYMIANGIEGFRDLQDSMNIYGSAGLVSSLPPTDMMNSSSSVASNGVTKP
jgi:hypothetical protein